MLKRVRTNSVQVGVPVYEIRKRLRIPLPYTRNVREPEYFTEVSTHAPAECDRKCTLNVARARRRVYR